MSKHSRRRSNWWLQEVGGAPHWLLVGAVVFVVGFGGIALASTAGQPTSAYTPRASEPAEVAPAPDDSLPPLTLPTAGERVVLIGDSWTFGYAADEGQGFAPVLASAFGWAPDVRGFSGVGYLRADEGGGAFPNKISEMQPDPEVSLVVMQGGLNDTAQDLSAEAGAVDAAFTGLREKFPNAQVVVVGAASPVFPVPSEYATIDGILQAAAEAHGFYYVSPHQETWLTQAVVEDGGLIDYDRLAHPTTAGHAYFAERLRGALQALSES